MTVETTINLLQGINAEVSNLVYAPELNKYPSSLDTMKVPIALSDIESGAFKGINNDNQSTDQYVVRVLFAALGQGDLGSKKVRGVRIFDGFRTKYLDPATYQINGQPVISTGPYRITIDVSAFTSTGLTIVEFPVGSERWWHGFEIRFPVKEEWLKDCD